jgi:predicted DNA-binding transcriptional regulator AlpA
MEVQLLVFSPETDKIIGRKELLKLVDLSYTTVWRMEREGMFPARKSLSARRVGWFLNEVMQWLHTRPALAA